MANPFGEKNIGPWEGQQVEYIPLDDLVLWTENPRDPLDGDYTNDDVSRIVPCVSPSPRGTINITYYLDEDRDISVEVGDDELASSTNLDRDDLFLVWNRDDAIPRQLLEALAQGRPLTRSWNSPSRGWSVR